MSYDITWFRPPDGISPEAALEDVWEERETGWPTRELTAAERDARAALDELCEAFDSGPSVFTTMLPFLGGSGEAVAHLERMLPHFRTLTDAGFLADDAQQGRVLADEEIEPLLRRVYAGQDG